MWFQKKVLPLQANICTTMSLTQIIGNVFKPRQKALEKHLNGGEALQHAVLNHLIHTAKDTEYGRNHAFDNIKDYEQFVSMVPVNTYEELKGDIDQVEVHPCQRRGSAEDSLCWRTRLGGTLPP